MTLEETQWLPDGSGGTMEPEKNEAVERLAEEWLVAREQHGESAKDMQRARENLVAVMHAEGIEEYSVNYKGDVFRLSLVEESKVSIVKDKPIQ